MNRSILLIVALCCSFGSVASADDFLLRLDAIGYVDKPASEKNPKETVFRSIEVVARPGSAFYGRVKMGVETLVVSGKLDFADNGRFHVHIRSVYLIDTGHTTPSRSESATNVSIALGEYVTLGSIESRSGKPERHSKTQDVLFLAEYRPTDD
jgi:hypothetical protein